MSLTVVTGRANSGKTGVVHDAVRAASDAGQSPVLLVPTHPDVVRATAEFARTHPLGIDVRQLDDWIAELWALHGDGRRLVEAPQRAAVVLHALEKVHVRALADSAGTPGFAGLVALVARRIAEESPDGPGGATADNRFDAELVTLLRAYRDALAEAGLVEPGEAARLLAGRPPPVAGPVFVHRFSDLDGSQEALLTSMSDAVDVWVSLPWEAGFPATESLDALVERLSRHALRVHKETDPAPANVELARFEAGLFRAPPPGPLEGGVVFCTAAGAEAEAALIAERAREACARFGPEGVAIVFRDAARHLQGLRAALSGAGVPADFDVLVPVLMTPFGRALRALLEAAGPAGGREAALCFMQGPFCGAEREAIDRLDARWRADPTLSATGALSDAARIGPVPGRAIKLARRIRQRRLDDATLQDWKELADLMLVAAHPAIASGADPSAEMDIAAHRALLDAVRLAAEASTGAGCGEVLTALEDCRATPGVAERPGRVQVTEAHRLRSRRFDAVIVGGLVAGDFSAEGRAPLASELADRLLGTAGTSEQARERLLFYNVCTRARELLVLTRQAVDSDGSSVRPSVFWEEALDLYRAPDADSTAETDVVTATLRLSELERAAPALSPDRARLRAQAIAGADGCDGRVERARTRARVSEHRLADPDVLSRLAERDEFSATELETYARCPYRWFYERLVRPASLDVSFDALRRGDLAHRVLAAFYREMPERLGSPRVTSERLGPALDLADEVFARVAADPRTPRAATLAEQDDLARTRLMVRDLVAADREFLPGFAPAHTELWFGTPREDSQERAGHPAVDLGGLRLRGSIDRVDEGEHGLAIIDYKTGSTVPKLSDFGPGRVLQVPLYALAASALLERPVVAGLYRSLRSGEARGFFRGDAVPAEGFTGTDKLADAAEVDEVLRAAVEVARSAADGIRAGEIQAVPSSRSACDWCAAAAVCGGGS